MYILAKLQVFSDKFFYAKMTNAINDYHNNKPCFLSLLSQAINTLFSPAAPRVRLPFCLPPTSASSSYIVRLN